MRKKKGGHKKKPKDEAEPEDMQDDAQANPEVWLPGRGEPAEGEALQYDPTAYDCLTPFRLDWPCLSFDVLRDALGAPRAAFPHSVTLLAGTQAASAKLNYLAVVRVSNITQGRHGTQAAKPDDSDEDAMLSGSDEDDDEPAALHVRKFAHTGGVNRVRAMPQQPAVAASFADTAQVQVWDLSVPLAEVAAEAEGKAATQGRVAKLNARQVHSHGGEGYALDWSPVAEGRLASGDCRARIHVWEPAPGGRWAVGAGLRGHAASVEDLQWSPTEGTVFASCSVDKSVRIWDTRQPGAAMLSVDAHPTDVNVISWNRGTAYMLASGGDEGALRVWDLRTWGGAAAAEPVADLRYHSGPVTSVEWSPSESSVLCTTGAEGQLAVWDLSLERDPEEEAALAPGTNARAPEDLPPQLLFVHGGQTDLKEAHWHSQIPGMLVSTAADGFNVFKPSNV